MESGTIHRQIVMSIIFCGNHCGVRESANLATFPSPSASAAFNLHLTTHKSVLALVSILVIMSEIFFLCASTSASLDFLSAADSS